MYNTFEAVYCPECDTEMDFIGEYTGRLYCMPIKWTEWRCPECGYIESNEPDWDEI